MKRHTFIAAASLLCALLATSSLTVSAQSIPKIAVTDLAYAQTVSQYFEAGTFQHSSKMRASGSGSSSASYDGYGGSAMHSGSHSMSASEQASGTYVSGRYSYIEQRELGSYTNDIKGALLRGTVFRLVQGKGFDAGPTQPTKSEQVLNQLKTGNMAKATRQPSVNDIIARIRKGEFNGADYVLFGVVSSIEFRDQISPLQGSNSTTYQYGLDLLADFSLINTRTYEIKAAFSAQGAGNDTKILSVRGDVAPPNRAKVMRETSQLLAQNVYEQLIGQLGNDSRLARGVRPEVELMQGQQDVTVRQPQPVEQVMILR